MLQSDCNTKNWEFITGWFKENHGLIRKIFIGYGWSTDYEFEDFEQQAMVLAAGIINKTGNISDCAFKKELLWALRSHLWQNRTKVRVSDVDEFQPDNNNPVRMLDYHEVEDFMFFNTDAGQEAGKIFDYELLHAILGLVSVRESEIVSAYFGLSEDVSLTSMKMSEVAEHFKISESAVSQLIKKFKNKVNEVFKEKGVKSSSSKEEILNAISEHNRIKAANVKEFVMSDIKIVNVESIKTSEPFISLFPVSDPVLHKVAKSMSKSGYDKSQPLIIWKDRDVLIDGHTRLQAAQLAVLDKVPVVEISFESEEEVIEYLFNLQFNRRNVKEYGLIKLAERIFKGVDDTNTDKSTFLTG
ncbi:MAG: hypothetical protein LBH05_03440, partial [Deferribacteraceae bacterium]|nr:hypothetical protein [Deferribacteraceae bacterium]